MSDNIDTAKLASRIVENVREVLQDETERMIKRLLELKACESPIEATLGAAMVCLDRVYHCALTPLILSSEADIPVFGEDARLLVHQYKFQNYRIDWAYLETPHKIFIECDGHDFHERTKEQAARDREKDRAIQYAGIPILRFTGSEIYRDPIYCASQAFDHMGEFYARAHQRGGG